MEIEKTAKIGAKRLLDLHRQLAGGRQDQRLGLPRGRRHMAGGKFLQQRQDKGRRLAGPGLGDLAKKVTARQKRGDRPALDGRWDGCSSRPARARRIGSATPKAIQKSGSSPQKSSKPHGCAPKRHGFTAGCRLPRTLEERRSILGSGRWLRPVCNLWAPCAVRNGWRLIGVFGWEVNLFFAASQQSKTITFVRFALLRDAGFCSHLVAVALAGPGLRGVVGVSSRHRGR